MEFMSLAMAVRYGTPILLFVLLCLNIWQTTIINHMQKEINSMKDSITWSDTCDERHKEINRRLDKLETKVFNGGK